MKIGNKKLITRHTQKPFYFGDTSFIYMYVLYMHIWSIWLLMYVCGCIILIYQYGYIMVSYIKYFMIWTQKFQHTFKGGKGCVCLMPTTYEKNMYDILSYKEGCFVYMYVRTHVMCTKVTYFQKEGFYCGALEWTIIFLIRDNPSSGMCHLIHITRKYVYMYNPPTSQR